MKFKIFMVFLLMAVLSTGCGKEEKEIQGGNGKAGAETEIDTEDKGREGLKTGTDETVEEQRMETGQEAETEPTAEKEPESPANYQRVSESGKVKFDCKVEIPDSFTGDAVHKYLVLGQCYGDEESILSKYVEGKEILEQFSSEAHDGIPSRTYYTMADGANANIGGGGPVLGSGNSIYYSNARVHDSEYQETYSKGQVSFGSRGEAIEAVKQELAEIGFSEFEFRLEAYPANHKTMEKIEAERCTSKEEQAQKKDEWTQEDDAYVVYGFQTQDALPVFHQWMSVFQSMAYDNIDNAVVSAVYSRRGIEQLRVEYVYYLEDTGETLTLKEFEEIAGIVEAKFENILNESTYEVTRAKLFQMVRLNEKQEYAAEPIWYFEVAEDGASKSVTLVDAVTGKEIVLK